MGIKKNFGYNLILTVCNYLFPLIVYPYISRVLQVDNIGICNFVDNIINYFVLFSLAGISSYGVREIARYKDDVEKTSKIFSTLFILNFILTIGSCILLVICTLYLDSLAPYRDFLWVGLIKLIFSIFLIEWFFQGMSMFRFITIRSILIRLVFVVSVFTFVKEQQDVLIYFIIYVGITIINGIVNWQYSHKFVHLIYKNLNFKNVLKPVASFGYYRIMTSMYTTFNVVFLGFVSTDTQVGYFSTASKLNGIIMSVFTAFTTVMVPHVSKMLKEGAHDRLEQTAKRTMQILISLSLPVVYFCIIYASEIIYLISGPGYEGAIIPFQIASCLILIIGVEQITVQQFLMASTKSNRPIMILSTVGAITGILLNILLTPTFLSTGSAMAWSVSEISIMIASLYFLYKYMDFSIWDNEYLKALMLSALYLIPLYITHKFVSNIWLSLALGIIFTLIVFGIITMFQPKLKEELKNLLTRK